MSTSRSYWALAALGAFLLGVGVDRAFNCRGPASVATAGDKAALAGIERLHELDERVTLLNDPKALQAEWTADAVRLESNAPMDVGRAAIYASDVRSFAASPDLVIVRYKPDIRDVQVAGDWAFESGLFTAGFRAAANTLAEDIHGKLLRVLHRESSGDWKFARVMVLVDQ